MERMWRKVNHSLRNSNKSQTQQQQQQQQGSAPAGGATAVTAGSSATGAVATPQSTDTISSAGGFGDAQLAVVAVQGLTAAAAAGASNATGRRLASSGGGSGQAAVVLAPTNCHKSLSQHVLQTRTASSERRRRRRRKSRPRRSGGMVAGVTSCVGDGGGDNMSSSGGFYTLKEHHQHHYRHGHHGHHAGIGSSGSRHGGGNTSHRLFASSAPSGTVMMYPNAQRGATAGVTVTAGTGGGGGAAGGVAATAAAAAGGGAGATPPDISLRQRAVAKLRMFNFHLNWDLHMTHCKPCGPRLSGSGNIITRRLCRNRRREDNELYRSNSFKFERFERKECLDELSNTLQKQIAICDDYSLPVDFVKKRPSSFDPCLAEAIPTNPEHWIAPSPQTEFLPFSEAQQAPQQQQQQQQQLQQQSTAAAAATVGAGAAVPPPPAPLATLPSQAACAAAILGAANNGSSNNNNCNNSSSNSNQQQQQPQQQQLQLQLHHSNHTHNNNTLPAVPHQQSQQQQRATLQHPPLPNSNIKQASVKLIEGYSDPKDTRQQHGKKVYHKKAKRRTAPSHKRHQQQQHQLQTLPTPRGHYQQQLLQQQQLQQQQQQQQLHRHSTYNNNNGNHKKDKRSSHYNSDSSAPKSSDEEADIDEEVERIAPPPPLLPPSASASLPPPPAAGVAGVAAQAAAGGLLNSPDSISDDLVRPLPPQLQRSPRKLSVAQSEHSKRQPSPYYYSDLLKQRDAKQDDKDRDRDREKDKQLCRQSTASEPPQLTQTQTQQLGGYRKSSSLDAPQQQQQQLEEQTEQQQAEHQPEQDLEKKQQDQEQQQQQHEQEEGDHQEEDELLLQGEQSTPKRYSFTEEGVRIIRCETPSTSTSEESDCSECLKRREWHARALALVRKTCNVQPLRSGELQLQLKHCDAGEGELLKCCPPGYGYGLGARIGQFEEQQPEEEREQGKSKKRVKGQGQGEAQAVSMPPHRLPCGACIPSTGSGGELEDYFRPRSIFYVHPHGLDECETKHISVGNLSKARDKQQQHQQEEGEEEDVGEEEDDDDEEEEEEDDEGEEEDSESGDNMASRRRQLYETAFDCRIAKSDDDLDEVDRITNHSLLLQLSNGNGSVGVGVGVGTGASNGNKQEPLLAKSRLECKRAKNSKNQALQEQHHHHQQQQQQQQQLLDSPDGHGHTVLQVQAELSQLQLSQVDQQNQNQQQQQQQQQQLQPCGSGSGSGSGNVAATSTQQLPARGYTPSPPSTAPLPMKFPGKHERYMNMNSIKSAPNLPSAQPAHPRLRDLRLPLQSLRQQHQHSGIAASSNENSLTDSAYVNPPSTSASASVSASVSASASAASAASTSAARRPRSFVLESGRVLELRRSAQPRHQHHHKQHQQHHHQQQQQQQQQLPIKGTAKGAGAGTGAGAGHNYSSTESIATSSSGGSMESLRSSTSEGNRSTSSCESRHSTSLSSHSSESGASASGSGGSGSMSSSSVAYPLRAPPVLLHSKLHILSPISDKSSQEPASASASASEQSQQQQQQQQQQQLQPASAAVVAVAAAPALQEETASAPVKRRAANASGAPNKALLQLADELLGSDSGISLHSREEGKPQTLAALQQRLTLPKLQLEVPASSSSAGTGGAGAGGANGSAGAAAGGGSVTASGIGNCSALAQELRDLPFDMPKLRRRKTLQQEASACTSGSATSVDLGELPFDMPKLRRRLRANQAEINNLLMHSTESSGISQASSSHSMRDEQKLASKLDTALFRQNLTLNLNEPRQVSKQFGSLDLRGLSSHKELNMNLCQTGYVTAVDLIDVAIPLERQGWYHGAITRIEAETTLRPLAEGSFLVRNCESTKQDYSLSLKGAKGFMHMRIQRNEAGQYILGQFSRPFETVPDMIRHFCLNRLPVRGAEHMCLIEPVIAQLL